MQPLQTIILSLLGSQVTHDSSSLCIRAAYLLGTETFCAGHLDIIIRFEEVFNSQENYKDKLRFIDFAFQKFNPEALETIRSFAKTYRQAKSTRNKPQHILLDIKKMEKLIDQDFEMSLKCEKESLEQTGLLQLKPLRENNELSKVFVNQKNTETPKPDGFPLSAMLAFEPDENDERAGKELFILPYHFIDPGVREHMVDKFGEEVRIVQAGICMQFPEVNLFTVDELRLIRIYLAPATTVLNKKIQEWMHLVRTKPEEGEKYFDQHLTPAAQQVQKLMDAHPLIQNLLATHHHKVLTRFALAQISMAHLWEFYRFMKVITPETEKALEEIVKRSPHLPASQCPVAIVDFKVEGADPEEPAHHDAHRKKYIDPESMNN